MLNYEQIKLDFRAKTPLYIQLIEQLRQQIENGLLAADEQLPPVRSLAETLRVNFNTVARAYRVLDIEGWISTQQGRGTFITSQSWPRPALLREAAPPLPEPDPNQKSQPAYLPPATDPDGPVQQQHIAQIIAAAAEQGVSAQDLLAYLQRQPPEQANATEIRPAAPPDIVQPQPALRLPPRPTRQRKANQRPAYRTHIKKTTARLSPAKTPQAAEEDKPTSRQGQRVRKHTQKAHQLKH